MNSSISLSIVCGGGEVRGLSSKTGCLRQGPGRVLFGRRKILLVHKVDARKIKKLDPPTVHNLWVPAPIKPATVTALAILSGLTLNGVTLKMNTGTQVSWSRWIFLLPSSLGHGFSPRAWSFPRPYSALTLGSAERQRFHKTLRYSVLRAMSRRLLIAHTAE